MKIVETQLEVMADGRVMLPALPDLSPGAYDVVLVIAPAEQKAKRGALNYPVDDLGAWPEGLSLRREDLYGGK